MLSTLDPLILPLINIFDQMELDLIREIASRFDTYDTIGGSLEWQLRKLDEISSLNSAMVSKIAALSKRSEPEIRKLLRRAGYANIDLTSLNNAWSRGLLVADPARLTDSAAINTIFSAGYKELTNAYKLIKTKALESARQDYMNIINRTYVETSSGVFDYQTSIRRGVQSMAERGITAATYQRGGKIIRYSIEAAVRRDTLTAVHRLANDVSRAACDELGVDYVEVSAHMGARVSMTNPIADHAGWQGKVYKLKGFDAQYGNLETHTGYPDDILGLGGVNCRHRMFPFIPGISVPAAMDVDSAENKKAYELSQEQRRREREIRKLKKELEAAKASGDYELTKRLKAKLKDKQLAMNEFCEKNGLKRDWNREMVTEEVAPKSITRSVSVDGGDGDPPVPASSDRLSSETDDQPRVTYREWEKEKQNLIIRNDKKRSEEYNIDKGDDAESGYLYRLTGDDGEYIYPYSETANFADATTDDIIRHFSYVDEWGSEHTPFDKTFNLLNIETQREVAEGMQWAMEHMTIDHIPLIGARQMRFAFGEYGRGRMNFATTLSSTPSQAFRTGIHEMAHYLEDKAKIDTQELYRAACKRIGERSNSRVVDSYKLRLVDYNRYVDRNDLSEIFAYALEHEAIGKGNALSSAIRELAIERGYIR